MGSSSSSASTQQSSDYSNSFNETYTQSVGQNALGVMGNVGAGSTLVNAINSGNVTGSYNQTENLALGASSSASGSPSATAGEGPSSLLGANITSWLPWIVLGVIGFFVIRGMSK
jgi:hypothetical protein